MPHLMYLLSWLLAPSTAVSTKPTPQPTQAVDSNQKDSNEGASIKDETVSSAPADEPERPKRKGTYSKNHAHFQAPFLDHGLLYLSQDLMCRPGAYPGIAHGAAAGGPQDLERRP